jgi:hypothetical protein
LDRTSLTLSSTLAVRFGECRLPAPQLFIAKAP